MLTKSSAPTRQHLPRRSLKRPFIQRSPSPKNFSSRFRTSMASAGSSACIMTAPDRGNTPNVSPPAEPSYIGSTRQRPAAQSGDPSFRQRHHRPPAASLEAGDPPAPPMFLNQQ